MSDKAIKLTQAKTLYDNLRSMVAVNFDQATANEAGSYVCYQGAVYLLPDGHTAGTTWANTTKVGPTNIGGEVSTLKSAIQQKYTKPNDGIPASDLASGVIPSVPVTDVQVNGSSVLSQGVANVPIGSASSVGVVRSNDYYGITISSNGTLQTYRAVDSEIKGGTVDYHPITPLCQHQSAFYGLAKAAGDSTQTASSNAVGTYTDAAKTAIKSMLGITELPTVTSSDNGKVLRVVNGAWAAETIASASGVSF